MMNFFEAMGWLALSLNVWGNFKLAKKSTSGWLIRLACNVAFVVYSIPFEIWPLLVNHLIFAGVNIYGWHEWRKDLITCKCGREYNEVNHGFVCLCGVPIRNNSNG